MTYKQKVLEAYKIERAKNLPAQHALRNAKYEVKYGRHSYKQRIIPFQGDTETIEYSNGWSAEVEIERDEYADPPWENGDGHGVVTDWQSRDDTLDDWELCSDRSSYRYYDWRATLPIAIRDRWDAPPYKTGNKRERAMRAIKSDYEYLRRWCNDDWAYIYWSVTLKDENGDEIDSESCGGVESDSDDYICDEVRHALARMLKAERASRREAAHQERIENRFRDAMSCGI